MLYILSCSRQFLLTRPLRDVTAPDFASGAGERFLLTRPLRDVTISAWIDNGRYPISTHTPLAGRDHAPVRSSLMYGTFLLTRPLRDVTAGGETYTLIQGISTHTPLAGRDGTQEGPADGSWDFYSHAPCGT